MRYVALLRGINVGGNSLVKMADLKQAVERCGFENVRTYIQSGNVVFEGAPGTTSTVERLETGFAKHLGMDVRVVVRTQKELDTILKQVPGEWERGSDLRRYLAFILAPKAAREVLAEIRPREGVDSVESGDEVLYLSTRLSGIAKSGFSKLSSRPVYKYLTIRNYSTVQKLLELMER